MSMNAKFFIIFLVFYMATPSICHRINSKLIDKLIVDDRNTISTSTDQRNDNKVAYVKAPIPMQIFQCMQQFNILKCMKIFILQRMERIGMNANSGNITADFINQILSNPKEMSENIFDKHYVQMSETELNARLLKSFRNFFKNREIKLQFIPGMVVKVVPSTDNKINLTVKKSPTTSNEVSLYARARRTKPYEYIIQFGLPAMILPAVLMGTVLPFLLPALKMATIASGILNNGALMAAIMYAAKSTTFANDKLSHNAGYHRDMDVPVMFS